jgi:hypothetical protein
VKDLAEQLVTICGVGALGGNLAEMLARMGCRVLRLIDRDRVEMRNLATQPYSRLEIGAPKARVLATALYRAVQTRAEPRVVELTTDNATELLTGSALVVDAFDNPAGRAAVSATARRLGLACLHVGFSGDGQYGSGIWEPGYPVPGAAAGDPCDAPPARPFVLVVASLAARAIADYAESRRRADFELTWGDLAIGWHDSAAS